MNHPLVSVIVPTYNGARWLTNSVGSALRQSYEPMEIIVVDDGSTDNTLSVLRDFGPRITVHCQARGDIGAARNRGITWANGDYLAFLDQDDVWQPDKLAIQMDYLRQHPDVDVLHGDAVEFDENGTVHESYFALFPRLRHSARLFHTILGLSVPLMSTTVIKAAFLREHWLAFPEGVSGVDDVGLFLEILARGGKFAHQDKRLTRRRLHAGNLSKVHFNRFAKRVVLYSRLVEKLADTPQDYREALRQGLRHAHFRTGECFWGEGDRQEARAHFREAGGGDLVGLQSLIYQAACFLPDRTAWFLRRAKRLVTGPIRQALTRMR